MNYTAIRRLIGRILMLIALLMILPLAVSLIYREGIRHALAFIIPILLLLLIGFLLRLSKNKNQSFGAREGFIIVGLAWLLLSLFGCIPFIISGEVKNFFDAFFEITSGFTTTGSSCLPSLEGMAHSILFWRSFSHWIGGMGILVFILALIPESKEGSAVHILRAESPGPQVGKLVSKMQVTSRILYLIYIGLTALEFIILMCMNDPMLKSTANGGFGENIFNSLLLTFGTAGTGGFAPFDGGCILIAARSQYVIAAFMMIFGINFTMFYYILIRNFKDIWRNDELKLYLCMIIVSVLAISFNIYHIYKNIEETFRYSFFTVTSIISTTGYANADYFKAGAQWPGLSICIITILTFCGACAGSTAGGMKTSRILIITKYQTSKIKAMINPRRVETIYLDGKPINKDTLESVKAFFASYFAVFALCAILISIYNPNMKDADVVTYLSSSLTCISNVGPGLSPMVGPTGTFANYSSFSKVILAVEMIAGRLEIFPILVLFYPRAWKKRV